GGGNWGGVEKVEKVATNRILLFTVKLSVSANPAETATVPGPTSTPTPEFPIRPAFAGGATKALMSKKWSGVGLLRLPLPIRSGRSREPRLNMLTFAGSTKPALYVGVRKGPV